ncbi:MAG: rhomboid family intramembrane serine protease [Aestuariivita sp.]|nr:rhomboid family intramembrane serine protease [Aestuariivita sp.]
MFPIRDHNPSGRTPYITYILIIINIIVFLQYLPLMADQNALHQYYMTWGVVPKAISSGMSYETLFSSMFLHGGFMHLGGNMLFLFIFGDNIEDEIGHLPFLFFYLISGVIAALTQVFTEPSSTVPTIGASGAVAGVMGSYLLLYPKARVDILMILFIFFRIFPVPAWIVLGLWLTLQFIGGFGNPSDEGGVAYWAHAGGFLAGLLLTVPLWLRRGGSRYWSQTDGHPPHAEAKYRFVESRIPKIRK